jgi:hypothetical protein
MDAIIFILAIVGGLVLVRGVASFFELRARMRDQMRSARRERPTAEPRDTHHGDAMRVTLAFEREDLELLEQACRELAEHARRDAEAVKGTSVESVHTGRHARVLGMAELLETARRSAEPEPPPANVRTIRP